MDADRLAFTDETDLRRIVAFKVAGYPKRYERTARYSQSISLADAMWCNAGAACG